MDSMSESKPKKSRATLYVFGSLFAFLALFYGSCLVLGYLSSWEPSRVRTSTIRPKLSAAESEARTDDFLRRLGAPKLKTVADAKEFFRAKKHSLEDLERCRDMLKAISPQDLEFSQAQALLAQIPAKIATAEEQDWVEKHPLKIVSKNWTAGGFGNVGLWRVTFENRSTRPVGNIRYETSYFAETGGKVGSKKDVIQKVIGPKQRRTLEINDGFIHKEAHEADIEIVGSEYLDGLRK